MVGAGALTVPSREEGAGSDDTGGSGEPSSQHGWRLHLSAMLLLLPLQGRYPRPRYDDGVRIMPRRRGDGTRPGAIDGVTPPLPPSQGCEQETTFAETTFAETTFAVTTFAVTTGRRDDGATGRRGDGTRPGAIIGVSPPLAPTSLVRPIKGHVWGNKARVA